MPQNRVVSGAWQKFNAGPNIMMKHSPASVGRVTFVSLGVLLWLCGCKTTSAPPPIVTTFRPEKLAEMDAAINQAIAEKKCPGGVLWFQHQGAAYHKAYGHRALVPATEPMT